MDERSVLVVGGTGGVGEGIVDALLADGAFAHVIVSSRDAGKLDALRDRSIASPSRLTTIIGSVADFAAAGRLRAAAEQYGPLAAVVASLGGWWEGAPLTELDEPTWQRVLDELLTTHFVCARTFVPALERAGCRYLSVGGGAGLTPVPGSALVSIAAAAQIMLTRALVAERGPDRPPHIDEFLIDGAVKTRGRHHGPVQPDEITAAEAGAVAAALLHDGTTGAWPHVHRDGPLAIMRPGRHAS